MLLDFADLHFNSSNTPVSKQFDDIYFSTQDGLEESYYVFQQGNDLWQKWQKHHREYFVIAETGFGTGLNFLAVAERFRQFRQTLPDSPLKRLYFISFEKYPLTATQLTEIHACFPLFQTLSQKLTACWQPRQAGCQRYHFDEIYLDLWFGDLQANLPQLGDLATQQIDCWFLDGFSPDKNPEMWNEQLYRQMYRLTRSGGSFATFTAASAVRKGLQAVGFEVKKRKGFGKKREMLHGEKPQDNQCPAVEFPYYFQQCTTQIEDIAIVGGGVASLFLAWSLIERGKKVTLYCQDDELAQNASGNLQGAIYPQLSDDDLRNIRFYVHSFDYALTRLKALAQAVDFEHDLCGVALYGYNEKAAMKIQKILAQGWHSDLIQALSAEEMSAALGLEVEKGGAFIPQGGWLSPVQLVQNGFAYLASKGLKIVRNHKVENPQFDGQKWGWQHQRQMFAHQALVLANGHQLREFAEAQDIPLYPVRGQVSHLESNDQLGCLKAVLCYDGYLTPRSAKGLHCLGASHWRDDADRSFRLEDQQQNLAKLQQNVGGQWAEKLSINPLAKVGIRAALRDRLPIVGQVACFERQKNQYQQLHHQLSRQQAVENAAFFPQLFLIAGLGSRGLTTAPLLGELLACLISNEPLPISQDIWFALSPNRTWIRRYLKG